MTTAKKKMTTAKKKTKKPKPTKWRRRVRVAPLVNVTASAWSRPDNAYADDRLPFVRFDLCVNEDGGGRPPEEVRIVLDPDDPESRDVVVPSWLFAEMASAILGAMGWRR